MLEKVTAFILRPAPSGMEILLLDHPYAGYQFPAGTVKIGESPEDAVVREVAEETGLPNLTIEKLIRHLDTILPADRATLIAPTTVFSRPDSGSFDWINLQPGMWLEVLRKQDGYTQINYEEPDQLPEKNFVTYQITGWVPDDVLSNLQRRYFFRFLFVGKTPFTWKVNTDHHTFTLRWYPLDDLPQIIAPQDTWLQILTEDL